MLFDRAQFTVHGVKTGRFINDSLNRAKEEERQSIRDRCRTGGQSPSGSDDERQMLLVTGLLAVLINAAMIIPVVLWG